MRTSHFQGWSLQEKVEVESWQRPLYLFLLYQRKTFINKVLGMFPEMSVEHWPHPGVEKEDNPMISDHLETS